MKIPRGPRHSLPTIALIRGTDVRSDMHERPCPKWGRPIRGIHPNTLTINLALHLKKQEIRGE